MIWVSKTISELIFFNPGTILAILSISSRVKPEEKFFLTLEAPPVSDNSSSSCSITGVILEGIKEGDLLYLSNPSGFESKRLVLLASSIEQASIN